MKMVVTKAKDNPNQSAKLGDFEAIFEAIEALAEKVERLEK